MKINNLSLFLLLSFLLSILNFFSTQILDLKQLLANSLIDQLTQEQIIDIILFREKWEIFSYIFVIIILLIKTLIIAAVLDIGCFFFNKEIKYKRLLNIVIKSEFVFLLIIILIILV